MIAYVDTMKPCACCLIALLLCFVVHIDGKTSPMRVVCRFDAKKLLVDYFDQQYSLCSHILFYPPDSYRTINADCKIRFSAGRNNSDLTQDKGYQEIMKLIKEKPQLKVMLSFGAYDTDRSISEIAACKNNSRKIRNDVKMIADQVFLEPIKHYNFSGLDIQYWWGIEEQNDLVVMTQQALKRNGQLFSITIVENINSDIDGVTRKINHTLFDFINFQPPIIWGSKGFHYAPLYENFPNNSSLKRRNVNETVHLIKHYHPLSKIVLGISFRGIGWDIPPNITDTRSPVTVLKKANGIIRRLSMAYSLICNSIQTKGWRVFYEDVARNISPYAVSPINDPERFWMSFEDPATVIVKSKYILEMGLGGVYLNDIDNDDFSNTCDEGPSPLLTAILKTLNTSDMSPITALTESILNTSITLNNSTTSIIRDENVALRCIIAFALGLLIVLCYVVTLVYVFIKFYLITRPSRFADMQVIYETIQ